MKNIEDLVNAYKEIKKLKEESEFAELTNDIDCLVYFIQTYDSSTADKKAEELVNKYRDDLNGIVRINNVAPLKSNNSSKIYSKIPTEEENCLIILEALLKLLCKKIVEKKFDSAIELHYGENISLVLDIIKKILKI